VDNFLVLFSSRTTGAPKAISIAETLVVTKIASVTQRLQFTTDSRIFMSGLMNNTTGVIFTFGALLRGGVVVFPDDADVASWPRQVARRQATHLQLRPAALKQFVEAAAADRTDLSCVRVLAYGGGSVPRALLEQGRGLLPCDWVQGYGLSETYGPFCWLDEAAHREGRHEYIYNVGEPDRTAQVRIDPLPDHPDGIGEILVRGALMEGYLDVATGRITPVGDWFRTGDLGTWGPAGDLLLKGRLSGALLTVNGHRIYPEEIEAVLADTPDTRDAVLIGIPQPGALLPLPVACLSGPIGAQSAAAVRDRLTPVLARSLSREKWPDLAYATTAAFPKSANGKIRRGDLARLIDYSTLISLSPDSENDGGRREQ
jgi:acyl-CoA synthetase (AMP-forming)/AMP-acid ligase II